MAIMVPWAVPFVKYFLNFVCLRRLVILGTLENFGEEKLWVRCSTPCALLDRSRPERKPLRPFLKRLNSKPPCQGRQKKAACTAAWCFESVNARSVNYLPFPFPCPPSSRPLSPPPCEGSLPCPSSFFLPLSLPLFLSLSLSLSFFRSCCFS